MPLPLVWLDGRLLPLDEARVRERALALGEVNADGAVLRARIRSEIWPVALDEPLPLCPVPLLPPDADVPLSLGEVLTQVYRRAAYARRIDYTLPVPPPPLRPAMQRWLTTHLAPPQKLASQ